MCVSAVSSFSVSAVLISGGLYSLVKIPKIDKRFWPIAAYPFAFGLQQGLEGIVWLEIEAQSHLMYVASLGFLFFSQFFWPFWIPFSAYWTESRNVRRKRILRYFAIAGFVFGLALYLPLLLNPYEGLKVSVVNSSIKYQVTFEVFSRIILELTYLALVIPPLFISTRKSLKTLGLSLILGVIISYAFYHYAFISVWCFIAALSSSIIFYFILKKL